MTNLSENRTRIASLCFESGGKRLELHLTIGDMMRLLNALKGDCGFPADRVFEITYPEYPLEIEDGIILNPEPGRIEQADVS